MNIKKSVVDTLGNEPLRLVSVGFDDWLEAVGIGVWIGRYYAIYCLADGIQTEYKVSSVPCIYTHYDVKAQPDLEVYRKEIKKIGLRSLVDLLITTGNFVSCSDNDMAQQVFTFVNSPYYSTNDAQRTTGGDLSKQPTQPTTGRVRRSIGSHQRPSRSML